MLSNMSGSFCRCRIVVTAACTAHWPAELHLAAALGICNPWMIGRQLTPTRLYVGSSGSYEQISSSSACNNALWVQQASRTSSNLPAPTLAELRSIPQHACTSARSLVSAIEPHRRQFGTVTSIPRPSSATYHTSALLGQAEAATAAEAPSAATSATASGRETSSNSSKRKAGREVDSSTVAGGTQPPKSGSGSSASPHQSDKGSSNGQNKRSKRKKSKQGSSENASSNASGSSSNIASSSASNSSSDSRPSNPVGSADVSYQSYPLPSYQMNLEERNSYDKARAVIQTLTDRGFKALIVGGWVRDKYLGRRASDIDIATNATPWELKQMFRYVIELPRSTVKLSHQGEVLEVTSFRGISRAASMFGVAMDAELRDFTLNALYYDPSTNQVLDFVGGVPDAQAGVLRLTVDPKSRLAEDPLRALRCVRFVVVMGLKMMPETAQAVREAAHMCSVQQGMPPRRIWLELRKLHRAEQQQPGSWCRSLRLCYHLGLLQHLFPWMQDPHMPDAAKQAVLVAEKLQTTWNVRQQQQQQSDVVPLSLLVAAMLHPASANRQQAYSQLEQYFPDPLDLEPINTLLAAADLTHDSSSRPADDAWAAVYASEHAQLCLDILAAWMPDVLAAGYITRHQSRMKQLADSIAHHKQLKHLQQDREQQEVSMVLGPASLAAAFEGAVPAAAVGDGGGADASLTVDTQEPAVVQLRHQRQQEELTAAIQALVCVEDPEQQQQQQPSEQQQQHVTIGEHQSATGLRQAVSLG